MQSPDFSLTNGRDRDYLPDPLWHNHKQRTRIIREIPITSIDDLAYEQSRSALFRRWLAADVDLLLIGTLVFTAISLNPLVHDNEPLLPITIGAVLWFSYYFFSESRWGATPGKLLLGLRVVDADGNVPSVGKTTVRTLMRLVEVNPVLMGALPAGLSIFSSKTSQRIGDRLAETYVLRKRDLESMPPGEWEE
jgi:uncharacterized RDD family membrane protein YckC